MQFLILTLATYRLARMIVLEDGPFDIFGRLRGLVFARFDAEHWITRGFNCVLCMSFWLAFWFAYFLDGDLILSALGIAGGVAIIQIFLERDK